MVSKIASYVGKYKINAFLSPLFMILEVAMDVFIPFVMIDLINGISEDMGNEGLKGVLVVGIKMLIMSILGLCFGSLSGINAAIASAGLAKNLRRGLFAKVQSFSFENIDKFSSSSLITRLTTDVSNVQNTFQMIIRLCVRAPLMMIMSLVMAFIVNKELALYFLIAAPILAIALFFMIKATHGFFKALFKEYDNMNNCVQENLLNIRTVKAYVREKFEIDKFEKISAKLVKLAKSAEKLLILQDPLMCIIIYGIIILISMVGGRKIVAGTLTAGELNTLFNYTVQILMSLMMISMIIIMVVMSLASAERIAEVLSEESTLQNKPNPVEEIADGSIKFENVSFAYSGSEDKYVLSDINLDIKSGETVGIIGGTGSSKSTLVQLIPRLYDVSEGSIKVGGVDVRDLDLKVLRDNVSMVLQKNELFSGTVNSNMRWGNSEATEEEIMEACRLACADEFVEKMDDLYNHKIEQGGNNVSGGQKQRLCIARALLKNPKILILDDSTSAVDMSTDAKIRSAFRNDIPDTTKIIIAQRIASVQEADKIIVLDEGKISGVGTHEELYKNNQIYREVYDSQVKGGDDHAA